jgi:diacylglycerol kinase
MSINAFRIKQAFFIAVIVILMVVYYSIFRQLMMSQKIYEDIDFIAFYSAGRIAQVDGTANIYKFEEQKKMEEAVKGRLITADEVLPFIHPAFIVPLLQLVVGTDYVSSLQRWIMVQLGLYFVSAWIISSLMSKTLPQRFLSGIAVILFFPAIISLIGGQDSAILFLGAAIWIVGLINEDDYLAGLGLALTTIRPHIAIVLAIPFIFKRQKVFAGFCLGAGALLVVSLFLVGLSGIKDYMQIIAISAGENCNSGQTIMFNVLGCLLRSFPNVSPELQRHIAWAVYAIALVGLCFLWRKARTIEPHHIGTLILIGLFTVPHLHYHDLVILLVPIILSIRKANKLGLICLRDTPLIVTGLSLLLLINHTLLSPYIHSIPYLLMILLFIWLWMPEHLIKLRPA